MEGDTYNKKLWSTEDIAIFVDDDGIVGFDYLVPLEVTDTVVEKSTLKNFDEIKDIFEQMIVTMNAVNEEDASYGDVTIDIDSVKLRYTRISEKDSFDTGLWFRSGILSEPRQTSMEMKFTEQFSCPSTRLMVR